MQDGEQVSTFQAQLFAAVQAMLTAQWAEWDTNDVNGDHHVPIAEITSVDTALDNLGYCETCSWETVILVVTYRGTDGRYYSCDVAETFGDLMRKLDAFTNTSGTSDVWSVS